MRQNTYGLTNYKITPCLRKRVQKMKLHSWSKFVSNLTIKNKSIYIYVCVCVCVCVQYMGYAMVQLVEALRYKPEGRGLYSRWGQ